MTLDLDIAVVHPWCPDVMGKAAKEDGAAAARREEVKTRKYQQEKLAVTGVVASCKLLGSLADGDGQHRNIYAACPLSTRMKMVGTTQLNSRQSGGRGCPSCCRRIFPSQL